MRREQQTRLRATPGHQPLSRRQFLRAVGLGGAALALGACAQRTSERTLPARLLAPTLAYTEPTNGVYELPPLPYAYNALEPHIDEQTMRIHHDAHHQGYVEKLNAALASHPEWQHQSIAYLLLHLANLPADLQTAVQRHGGGHFNHTLFWATMQPNGGGAPGGALAQAIATAFGSFGAFQEQFNQAAGSVFGSGWAWLVLDGNGRLEIVSTSNQDSPYSQDLLPLLGIDVWEHAYYLNYENRRGDYIGAWWQTLNWDVVAERFAAGRG